MTEENLNPKMNIGEKLKSAREKAGLSIDAVQKDTKIQKKYLVAIENDDFEALPGKFYVRAFVKTFANAVGLNGDKFVEDYLPNNNVTGEVKSDAKPVKDQALTASRFVRPTPTETKDKMDFRKYLPLGVIAVIVVIVLVVVGFAVVKTHNDSSDSAPTNSKVTVSNDDVKKETCKEKSNKENYLEKR
ncbi:hypothetical protein BGL40_00660 [Fructilactobacillus sanfranciscensis]|uniref:helix-turn-helix domain-containing protein n=1 Tax=Fructilactobacillus sanfranciscensis TaxID=1625 RepID=UPI000CD3CF60|nr:helix-turn-helix transcriptional regulator [Fructilactobacillus sanfranciscensis]POH16289.1 hypothetical protein BGL40_00660 [Fructilactobacillus sanfranciscensis]